MTQKTMAIVVIAIVIVAVIGVAAYYALSSGSGGENSGGNGNGNEPTGIEGATSLQYTVDITGGDAAGTYKFYGKNLGTSNMMIRVEIPIGDMNIIYIVNGAEQKAWANEGAGWIDLSDSFSDQWSSWDATWQGYTNTLSTWTSGDYTYDDDGSTITITDISVDPALADSLFQPPAT